MGLSGLAAGLGLRAGGLCEPVSGLARVLGVPVWLGWNPLDAGAGDLCVLLGGLLNSVP